MIRIVLVEPEIPQNTGNVSRTCAVTGSALYLVRPLGFTITDAKLKRAGLDYWDQLDLHIVDSMEELIEANPTVPFFYFTSHTTRSYADVAFPEECFLVFGRESRGLSAAFLQKHADEALRIPMRDGARCLNLSNAVAVVAYEALRQHGFYGMK